MYSSECMDSIEAIWVRQSLTMLVSYVKLSVISHIDGRTPCYFGSTSIRIYDICELVICKRTKSSGPYEQSFWGTPVSMVVEGEEDESILTKDEPVS